MAILFAILLSVLSFAQTPPAEQPQPEVEINLPAHQLPPLHVGDTIIAIRHPTLQTGVVQDLEGTVYQLTALGNGEKKLFRLSRKHMVQKLVMYKGWPYILNKKGKLYALDLQWKNSLRSKLPAVGSRMLRRLPYAALTAGAFAAFSLTNIGLHGGVPAGGSMQPGGMALTGALLFYLVDNGTAIIFRSPGKLGRGGNFFTRVVARGVKDVVADHERKDFRVEFAKGGRMAYLSELAPAYATENACIYALTRMALE